LAVRERTLASLDAATGLRVNELLALGWGDVNLEKLERRVTRSIGHRVLGNCKAEASAKPVPMDSHMAEDLLRSRRQTIYASDEDHVFASETMRGRQPFWSDNLMKREIRPVAKANGIHEKIRWQTSRHSFVLAEGDWRRCQNRSGAPATRRQQEYAQCLHACREAFPSSF
jgi:integrase